MVARDHSIGKIVFVVLIVGIAILLAIWTFRRIEKLLPQKLISHPLWNTKYSPGALLIGILIISYVFLLGQLINYLQSL